ncbi:hypothetical protein [Bradyrhizobium cenepequi]|uniref:hypothetical protein n=1 Tax=Bradyrhizobium cenepequi TaxID=2821403 RepID=UPI001CE38956|nr:hypothetical protein [Bradyrhizobium cenepequi]MCA6105776.1 hypothetical protein [Bradyrhizobium cenepequi]
MIANIPRMNRPACMPALLPKLMLRERRKRNTQAGERCARIESCLDFVASRGAFMKIDHAKHRFLTLMCCGYSETIEQWL